MTWSAMIIGLGAIGMKYDYDTSCHDLVLTHSKALHLSSDFDVVAVVDPVDCNRVLYDKRYEGATYKTLSSALSDFSPDVVFISSPTQSHAKVIKTLIKAYSPKIILCEKPMAYEAKEIEGVVKLCEQNGVPLFVNYYRQADPSIQRLIKMIGDGDISEPFKGVVWYSKGLIHNGLHFISLLTSMFGAIEEVEVLGKPKSFGSHDLEVDLRISFANSEFVLLHSWDEYFAHYSVEIMSPTGRILIEHSGQEISFQPAIAGHTVHSLRMLGEKLMMSGNFDRYQANVLVEIKRYLTNGTSTLVTGRENLNFLKFTDRVRETVEW